MNDTDNATKVEGAQVYVVNSTRKTYSVAGTTNASGIAILDLANLPTPDAGGDPYAAGDIILLVASYDSKSDSVLYTVAGGSKAQTLNLTFVPNFYPGEYGAVRLMHLTAANTTAGALFVKVYDGKTGQLLSWVEAPASDTHSVMYGYKGLGTQGFIVVREGTGVVVTVSIQ